MNKEKLKDVIAGILSILFIGIVFYLYFMRVFSGYGYFVDTNRPNFDEFIVYQEKEHGSCHINVIEPTIVLRMDDVRAYSVPTPYLVDEIIERNLSVTLGVIPRELEKDTKMQEYLLEIRENPNVEIAQHGTYHNESDININEGNLLEGNVKIQRLLGVRPVTYIPPYNKITEEAREVISKYFNIISAGQEVLKEGENIAEIGYTVETYDYNKQQITSTDDVIEKCKSSLEKTNLCVIEIHPQEYSFNIDNPVYVSAVKFDEYREMLDKLQELNASFSTFNSLVDCSS